MRISDKTFNVFQQFERNRDGEIKGQTLHDTFIYYIFKLSLTFYF